MYDTLKKKVKKIIKTKKTKIKKAYKFILPEVN